MSTGVLILLILVLAVVLIKAADRAVIAVKKLSRATDIGTFTIAAILVSLSTSLPELFVGISSATTGVPSLSLGNVIGANIANFSLVAGLAGLFTGVVYIKDHPYLDREVKVAFFAGILPFILLWDRSLSRIDGLILISFYLAYVSGVFHGRFFGKGKQDEDGEDFLQGIWRGIKTGEGNARQDLLQFLIAAGVLLVSAYFLVRFTSELAVNLGIPFFLVGLLFLSIGTTLPELALAFRSIRDHEPSILIGNRFGAIVTNAALVLGTVALISPIEVEHKRVYFLSAITFVLVFLLFWFFVKRNHYITRLGAGILFTIYIVFFVLEFSGFKFF